MKGISEWFGGLDKAVQISIVAVVGVAIVVGLLLGGNFMPTVNGVLGVK